MTPEARKQEKSPWPRSGASPRSRWLPSAIPAPSCAGLPASTRCLCRVTRCTMN